MTEETKGILTPDQRPRVFVSSAIEELKEERKAVLNAIIDLRLHPVLFESGARPYPPRDVYRAYLEQSHIYVGIFWKSYGWIAPGMTISGIEDEFNLSIQKPRLVYVKEAPEGRETKLEQLLQRIRDERTLCYKTFSTREELFELVKNDVIQLLSERFCLEMQRAPAHVSLPSYLQSLQVEMEEHGIVRRESLIQKVQKELAVKRILLVTGDPGIGKTYLLGDLGQELNAIYISLRNKSAQQVFYYLANLLAIRRGQLPQNLPSENEARAAFQEELENNSAMLLIDDVDQNPTVVDTLLGLEFFSCKVILAARSSQLGSYPEIAKFNVPSFSHDEVECFLKLQNIKLPPGRLQKLFVASHGNPLYLYYFTKYQISPLPKGLQKYQDALWQQLLPLQQELMCLIAHSFTILDVSNLHELLNTNQVVTSAIMETKHLIDSVVPLFRQVEGRYELFHPYFKEYICTIVAQDSLSHHYHKIIGEYAVNKNWTVAAAFHFLRAKDDRVKSYLVDAATATLLRGDWILAEEFIQQEIEFTGESNDKHAEAYARFLLAQVYQEVGRYKDARCEVDTSLKLFEETKDKEWKEMVKLWSSMLLIEEGQAKEAIDILEEAASLFHERDSYKEAAILLNLAYAYKQVSRFRDGAKAAQQALDLFTKLGDERGIHGSLVNLSACVGELGDNDLQRQYAEQIIDIATKHNLPRLRVAGLNHLAIVQRRDDDPIAAQHTLEECIAICQGIGSIELETMNIANLGNAFLDQKLFDKAEAAYTESLVKAKEHQLIRNEAHALGLIARLKHRRRRHKDAVKLGNEALTLYQKLGEHLRIASTSDYLARSYTKLGKNQDAAVNYENAGEHYKAAEQWDDAAYCYEQAASLWNLLEQPDRALDCVSQGVDCTLLNGKSDRTYSIFSNISPKSKKAGEFYSQTLEHLIGQAISVSLAAFMYNFSTYCKQHYDPNERSRFKSGLESLVDALKKEAPAHLFTALAVGITQISESIFPISDLDGLAERTASTVDHLYYRSLPEGLKVWTIGLSWQKPIIFQIVCLDEDPIIQRTAMVLGLIILASKERLEKVVSEFGGNKEQGFSLKIMTQKNWEANIKTKLPQTAKGESLSASTTESNVPWEEQQPPTILILHDDYETASDWTRYPGNKTLIWVLLNVYGAFIAQCVHRRRSNFPKLPKKCRELCEALLV